MVTGTRDHNVHHIRKKVLIVNCYFDEVRYALKRNTKVPQPLTPTFLAGMFSRKNCDIKLYNEMSSGPLEDAKLLSSPDMLVLTGLNTAFDRMLHVTAYARTLNEKVVVVAGGPVIRSLTQYSRKFFDYACTGDVEQMAEVIADAFGRGYISGEFLQNGWAAPRYDLTDWFKFIAHVESSRSCYYNCDFCTLTGEKACYQKYDLEYLRRQLIAAPKKPFLSFNDNNFASPDKQFTSDRLALIDEYRKKGKFKRWGALVTNDFFTDENLAAARRSGCGLLFSGVETFNVSSLRYFKKYQNVNTSQVDMIKRCLQTGIFFLYGMILDVGTRRVKDLYEELDFIVQTPAIPLPSYFSMPIPMLKTPLFYRYVKEKRILPDIKLRDLDATTMTIRPLDPMPEVIAFLKNLQNFNGYRKRALRHAKQFDHTYKRFLTVPARIVNIYNTLLVTVPKVVTAAADLRQLSSSTSRPERTYVGSSEMPDAVYKPKIRVDARYESYFKPTMLTDHDGNIWEPLRQDLLSETDSADKLREILPLQKRTGT